jgi:hypothetical protein
MSSATSAWRKLPAWHGLFSGAALFLDEHSLISVRSSGYEEQVKRLHFKDIQAIVVSKAHRFGVSRKEILCAFLLWVAIGLGSSYSRLLATFSWPLLSVPVLAWLYLSIKSSCRFRVYTAVSQEELPSVRRPWTASKVLAELTPRIEAAQGTLPQGWIESVTEDRPLVLAQAAVKADREAATSKQTDSHSGRFSATGILVVALLLDVVLTAWDLQRAHAMPGWIGSGLALVEAAAAVWVIIQNRGMNASLLRLGAAALIFLGLTFYGQFAVAAIAQAQAKHPLQPEELRAAPAHRTFIEFYIGGCTILAILGGFLTVSGPTRRGRRLLVE